MRSGSYSKTRQVMGGFLCHVVFVLNSLSKKEPWKPAGKLQPPVCPFWTFPQNDTAPPSLPPAFYPLLFTNSFCNQNLAEPDIKTATPFWCWHTDNTACSLSFWPQEPCPVLPWAALDQLCSAACWLPALPQALTDYSWPGALPMLSHDIPLSVSSPPDA